jgi:hypothetical protein
VGLRRVPGRHAPAARPPAQPPRTGPPMSCSYAPMPMPWAICRLLPSLCRAGATMTSAF